MLALIGGFFYYRRWKKNKALRGSGTALVGGGGSNGFKKHENAEDDGMFGNSSMGSGAAYGNEKSFGNDVGAGAGAGYGATGWKQQQQQPQQAGGNRQSWDAPSYHSTPQSPNYPPAVTMMGSTANLLGQPQQQQQSYHDHVEQREMQEHLANQQQQQFNAAPAMAAAVATAGQPGQSPFAESPGQGAIHVVKRTFEPSLEDELVLFVSLAARAIELVRTA